MENTSGAGSSATVPGEIDRWSWGAFMCTWVWGVFNKTYISFLMFVPVVNIVMPFVLGAKGNAWAWRNKKWDSIEHFKKVQRRWSVWSIGITLFFAALFVGLISYVVIDSKNNAVYKLAVQQIEHSEQIAGLIGSPVKAGIPWDLIETDQDTILSFSFDVDGPDGGGIIWLAAQKEDEKWHIRRMIFTKEADGNQAPEIVDIVNEPTSEPSDEASNHGESA